MKPAVLRAASLVALLTVLAVVATQVQLPNVTVLRTWIAAVGPTAPAVFMVAYALVVPTPLPKSVLSVAAGLAFGVPTGVLVVVVGGTAGAVLAFVLGRLLGREVVVRYSRGHVEQVDRMIERHGAAAALGVRLVPVLPFTVLNYACGVTAMRLRHYAVGTVVGIVPGSVAWVAFGSLAGGISPWRAAAASVTLGLVTLGAGMVWRYHRRQRPECVVRPALSPDLDAANPVGID